MILIGCNFEQNVLKICQLKFFVCIYKIVDISAETWNKTAVSVIKAHQNDDVNKTLFLLLCISHIGKDGMVRIFMTRLIQKSKENMMLKKWRSSQNDKLESAK